MCQVYFVWDECNRVATAQGNRGIWMLIFFRQGKHGNFPPPPEIVFTMGIYWWDTATFFWLWNKFWVGRQPNNEMKSLQQALLHLGLCFRVYIGSSINVIFWGPKKTTGKLLKTGKTQKFCLDRMSQPCVNQWLYLRLQLKILFCNGWALGLHRMMPMPFARV